MNHGAFRTQTCTFFAGGNSLDNLGGLTGYLTRCMVVAYSCKEFFHAIRHK